MSSRHRVIRLAPSRALMVAACLASLCGLVACDSPTAPIKPTAAGPASATSTSQPVSSPAATSAPATVSAPATGATATRPPAPSTPASTPAPTTSPANSTATVVVTYSGWNTVSAEAEVAAFVQNVDTNDGQCTLTMTSGAITRTASKPATADVSTTQCGTVAIPGAQLTPGQWTAVISFASSRGGGAAAPVQIQVGG